MADRPNDKRRRHVYEIDGELSAALDLILEADFLGRSQQLTLTHAERRLWASLRRRYEERQGKGRTARNDIEQQAEDALRFTTLSYRSVAYDAAGLTSTLVRRYPDCAYLVVDAHMAMMRSMICNASNPDTDLLDVAHQIRLTASGLRVQHVSEELRDVFLRVDRMRTCYMSDEEVDAWDDDRKVGAFLLHADEEEIDALRCLPSEDIHDYFMAVSKRWVQMGGGWWV